MPSAAASRRYCRVAVEPVAAINMQTGPARIPVVQCKFALLRSRPVRATLFIKNNKSRELAMTAQVSSQAADRVETAPYEVLVEVRNHIGHLTLNRPAGLNALTLGMVRSMQQQLDAWAHDPQIRAVVLRGAGDKAFCAGGDIR